MTLWGVDQEFMGAGGYLLKKILSTNPGPEAAGFSQFGKIDPEFERIIFGYDFVVLVPAATASHDME